MIAMNEKEMRAALCDQLIERASSNKNLIVIDAYLMAASGLKRFADAYPEQAINCGIQEQNMVGVAGGGLLPWDLPLLYTHLQPLHLAVFLTNFICLVVIPI